MDKASTMVEKLLRPIDDRANEHKQNQLRELALINGPCFLLVRPLLQEAQPAMRRVSPRMSSSFGGSRLSVVAAGVPAGFA